MRSFFFLYPHAGGHAEGNGDGGQYGDDHMQDFLPEFFVFMVLLGFMSYDFTLNQFCQLRICQAYLCFLTACAFSFFLFLAGLGRLHGHLLVRQVGEDAHQHRAGSEIDACLLDEGSVIVLLSESTLAGDTDLEGADLEGAEVAQTDDFASPQCFGDDIFQCHEHGIHVGFRHGTGSLDAFGHLADVHVAIGLHMAIILGRSTLFARVHTWRYGIGHISCRNLVVFNCE